MPYKYRQACSDTQMFSDKQCHLAIHIFLADGWTRLSCHKVLNLIIHFIVLLHNMTL